MPKESSPAWPRMQDGVFATTQWSMIADAAREGDVASERALAKLCPALVTTPKGLVR